MLAVEEAGDPDGLAVLVHNGSPNSRHTPTDAAVFTGELAEYLTYSEQDGFAPGADARLLDHDGHLTLAQNRIGEVHAWLAAHA